MWAAYVSDTTSIRARLVTGVAFNLVATVLNQGSTFLANVLLANLFGIGNFGSYAMVQSTLLSLSLIAQTACGSTAAKFVAEFRTQRPDKCGRLIGALLLVAVMAPSCIALALVYWSDLIAMRALHAPDLALPLKVGALFLVFSSLNGLSIGVLAGLESYRELARSAAISAPIYLLSCLLLGMYFGLVGAILGMVISSVAQAAVLGRAVMKQLAVHHIQLAFRGSQVELHGLMMFILPAAVAGYVTTSMIWWATTRLVQSPTGYSDMAIYSASTNIRMMILFLPTMMSTVVLSVLNNLHGTRENQRYRRTYGVSVFATLAAACMAAGTAALLSGQILSLFGDQFTSGKVVLLLLILSTIPESLFIALYPHIQTQGRMWLSLLAIVIPRETLLVSLAIVLVPSHGATGLAVAYLSASFLGFLVVAALVLRAGSVGTADARGISGEER